MFKFFTQKKWFLWSILGSVFILSATASIVYIDVQINKWFGEFYDVLQKALSEPGSVSLGEFLGWCYKFAKLAAIYILVLIFSDFFTSHYTFRWRTAMADFYHDKWNKAHSIEGASQRVQEDTLKFARIMEGLGVELLRSIMTLIAFLPILYTLSEKITELPWFGAVAHSMVWVAIITALGGTILLALVGIKLPGIEYDIQKKEAAYRKILVLGEDNLEKANSPVIDSLYDGVRKIHYRMYFHYLYFNAAKWSYLQGMVIVPYIALAPTIITGAVTLGFVQQIARAFGRVESSLQYLVRSWPIIVELISVRRRLAEFEKQIEINDARQEI
jgi:peptide/bleomycin uptake transporter